MQLTDVTDRRSLDTDGSAGSAEQVPVDSAVVERFKRDLDALIDPQTTIGLAVSGGPDSLALLLLAAKSRPLKVEAATVDHVLRPESRAEAEMVAALCERLGVRHTILTADWEEKPETAKQERARLMRYALLGGWARERDLGAILTGHHLDDQAETLLMRLIRGSGVKGLAGMRRLARPPGTNVALARPLLGWRHSELAEVCATAGIEPAHDPSNDDEQFERIRVRRALAAAEWLDPQSLAISARNLARADAALQWAAAQEWDRAVTRTGGSIVYRPSDAPREIRRRIAERAILAIGREGRGSELRGAALERVLDSLATGRKATLRGVLCAGGREWRFSRAPARKS